MQCPIDGTQLVIAERSGVEIDYCPQCRGVWLDRGELDKIIERSGNMMPPPAPSRGSTTHDDHQGGKRRKKSGVASFLDDIFDF